MYLRLSSTILLGIFLIPNAGCKKAPPPEEEQHKIARIDRVGGSPLGTTQMVLQKTFNLRTSVTFPFEIPAHAAQPRLHGAFRSFVGQPGADSDDSANIDFAVLNEEQQNESAGGDPSGTVFSAEPSHDQSVNIDLPPSFNSPVKYYLVFSNPDKSKSLAITVEANLRVDF